VKVNGRALKVGQAAEVSLVYKDLPVEANVDITTGGGWPTEQRSADYPAVPALAVGMRAGPSTAKIASETLMKPLAVLSALRARLLGERDTGEDIAFLDAAVESCEATVIRATMDPGPGYYRAITSERRESINRFFELAAHSMYQGFAKRMEMYATKGDTRQKRIARLFAEAQADCPVGR
jgi:hypothetical protein